MGVVTLSKWGAHTLFASALVYNVYVPVANAKGLAVDPINFQLIDPLEASATASSGTWIVQPSVIARIG